MGCRKVLVLIAFVVAVAGCSNDGSTGAASSTSLVVPETANSSVGSDPTANGTSIVGTEASVSDGTLALPSGSSPDVVVATFRDSDGRRCIEVGPPQGSRQGVCYDDEQDGLTYVTRPDDTGSIFVFGGIELPEASALVAVLPDGSQIEIPMISVDGWPERAFVALFDVFPTRLQASDASGVVIATATN